MIASLVINAILFALMLLLATVANIPVGIVIIYGCAVISSIVIWKNKEAKFSAKLEKFIIRVLLIGLINTIILIILLCNDINVGGKQTQSTSITNESSTNRRPPRI